MSALKPFALDLPIDFVVVSATDKWDFKRFPDDSIDDPEFTDIDSPEPSHRSL